MTEASDIEASFTTSLPRTSNALPAICRRRIRPALGRLRASWVPGPAVAPEARLPFFSRRWRIKRKMRVLRCFMLALAKTASSHLADELIAQAVASVEAADHFSFPFPHIFFRNFFPTHFYRDLVRSIPTEGYDPITGTGTRLALRLYGDNVEKIAPALRSAWAAVSAMLTSKELETAIRIKLSDGLEIRARGDKVPSASDLKLVAKPVIYRDIDGYQIK